MVSIEKVASLSERRRSCSSGFSPLVLLDVLSKNSFYYRKLPQVPINLTVRKLDGSFFVIEVANSATIEDLKQAVETCFSHFPKKGMDQISWPHVWGSFCLCYDGQKLIDDDECIKSFGMKDGDQLYFARHAHYKVKRRSRKLVSPRKHRM